MSPRQARQPAHARWMVCGFSSSAPQLPARSAADCFATSARRWSRSHGEEIDAIVGEWAAARDYRELEQAFNAHEVTFTRVYSMADIFSDPHFAARGMLAKIADDELGSVTVAAPVPRLSRTPGRIDRAGGAVGRDTREVLSAMLGVSDAEIAALEGSGAIRCG